ncbi:hypothetical protein QAD02_020411 [Eretmocerus hayati]|uniref:Uncharacterized protein n=1 Tax=Eretmocerus hayati TaxID=131215 RepID=A0ACC2PNC2_9HYME|nr:hypothetical protein QAD02_020411 [Eretmocerus hayati]
MNNPSVDPMHDLLEGVCRVDVAKILNNLINVKKHFRFQDFIDRIEYFDRNSPDANLPSLSKDSIKDGKLMMSASEIYFLVTNLPLMIGDLVPSSDKSWKLFLLLRQIVCTAFAHSVTQKNIESFGDLVTSYPKSYVSLFKKTLRPKHHNLLHYQRLMLLYGPLKVLSCLRFEAKHRQLKQCSQATTSRASPDYTIAVKHQLQLCYRFLKKDGFCENFESGPPLSKFKNAKNFGTLRHLFPDYLSEKNCYSWVRTGGTYYRLESFTNTSDIQGVAKFGKIVHIIVDDRQDVYFIHKDISMSGLNVKFGAYEIEELDTYGCMKQNVLEDYECYFAHVMPDTKTYLPRYFY